MKKLCAILLAFAMAPAAVQAGDTAKATAAAAGQQRQAIDTMQHLLDLLETAGDVDALRAVAVRALGDQVRLNQETGDWSKNNLGKSVSELGRAEADRLNGTAGKQTKLADDVTKLLQRIGEAKEAAERRGDKPTAETLGKVLETAKGVPEALRQAGQNLGDNKIGPATGNQRRGTEGLGRMIGAFDELGSRRFETLSRELRALIDELKQIKDVQTSVRDEAAKAGESR